MTEVAETANASPREDGADEPLVNSRPKDEKNRFKYMKRTTLVILLGILNVFLVAILIFIIAFFAKDKSQRVTINPSQTFCLPCEEVSIHPDDDILNFRYFTEREENGKKICCTDHGHYLEKLMELYVERKHALKASEMNTMELQAACNSTISDFMPQVMGRVAGIQSTRPDGSFHIVDWKFANQGSAMQFAQNVTFDAGTDEFVVNKAGYYYVYAQVTMKIMEKDLTDPSKSLCFNIYKKPAGGNPEKLLENSRTRCKFHNNEAQSTGYIGAVFNLNKDDRLMVKVSDKDNIEMSAPKSYFGLHII